MLAKKTSKNQVNYPRHAISPQSNTDSVKEEDILPVDPSVRTLRNRTR